MSILKSQEIRFLQFPCRIVVCESCFTPGSCDPETRDSREYARIIPKTSEIGGIWLTQVEFAGTIEWGKYAWMLTDEHRAQIEAFAARVAEENKTATERAKALQAWQRVRYADMIAKYGE